MDIKSLVPVDYSNQRVLLSSQVAQVYNCPRERIKKNFQNNRKHFKEGVHFFKLEGAALQAFKHSDTGKNFPCLATAQILYLWTKRGVARHCKSINTNEAWNQFEQLEDFYFKHAPVKKAPEFHAPQQDFEQLLALADKFHDPNLRDKVLIFVVNKLCGENIL